MPSPPQRFIHVVAAVITDARGRILLARRTDGRDLAGLWEFPGGKREPGESPEAALVRELQEELGITVQVGAPLINVPQQYPDKRLTLDVRHVTTWQGTPRGIEGQALAWVAPEKLTRYPMPPADRPVVAALLQPDRYLVTPEPGEDGKAWLACLSGAVSSGIRRVQLRARDREAQPAWHELVVEAIALCRKAKAEVLVNGDIDLARELGIGVHLRAAQLDGLSSRPLAEGLPVAASCHDVAELQLAQALGCDFAVLGSVLPTATHPDAAALGWEGFAKLREAVSLPLYAIGGLSPQHIPPARQHGAQGIAAIRSLWP
ncbi:MAG TPA: Nudix family hydrolase [Pseudoxanthomonas sp.]|nr:Nudix family hydrolase [Pseudoxanthomonas sp.]